MSDNNPTDLGSNADNVGGIESSPHLQCIPSSSEPHSNLDDQILSLLDNPDFRQPKQLNSVVSDPGFPEASSDESEEEVENGTATGGYMPLPQTSDEEIDSENDEKVGMKEELASSSSHGSQVEHLGDNCSIGQCSGGEQTSSQPEATKLGTQAVEQIKQAMSGFVLPSSSIPEWAKQVPEDIWKKELMQGLQERKRKKQKK